MFFHKFRVFLGKHFQIFYPKKKIVTFPLWILEKGMEVEIFFSNFFTS